MKKSHGGKREGAGRHLVADPKITLILYPHKSLIDTLGADTAKTLAINALQKAAKKIQNT